MKNKEFITWYINSGLTQLNISSVYEGWKAGALNERKRKK